ATVAAGVWTVVAVAVAALVVAGLGTIAVAVAVAGDPLSGVTDLVARPPVIVAGEREGADEGEERQGSRAHAPVVRWFAAFRKRARPRACAHSQGCGSSIGMLQLS